MSMYDGTELIEEITVHDPESGRHAFCVEGVPGPLATMAGEMTVRPVGDGCEITFESEYTLKGGILGAAIDLLVLRAAIRREHRKILADLEHHLNTGDHIGKGGARTPAPVRAAA